MDVIFTSDEISGTKLVSVAGENAMNEQGSSSPSMQRKKSPATKSSGLMKQSEATERTPLIRPREPNDEQTEDTMSPDESVFSTAKRGAHSFRRCQQQDVEDPLRCWQRLIKALSQPMASIFALLVIVIVGIVLVLAANLKTDGKGVQVKPEHVFIYTMLLISIFIAWMVASVIPQKLYNPGRTDGTLIPRHLLTGVGIFGTFSATTQVLVFLDFLKCSRHVDGLSHIYGVYPWFKIAFIYFQIYFFYKFSRDGIRNSGLSGDIFFVMVTLGANLCIWFSVFFNDVASNPKLQNVTWLNRYYYGIEEQDRCGNRNLTSKASYDLHMLINSLAPYISTFSMEYALLASGLLLQVWMVTKRPVPKVPKVDKQTWTLWRSGFIAGLMAIPIVFAAYYMNAEITSKFTAAKVMLYFLKASFFFALLCWCIFCLSLIGEKRGFIKKKKGMKLEVVLLGISCFLGLPASDLARGFAAISEVKNYPWVESLWYLISAMCELIACVVQFFFIKKAYQYKLPEIANEKITRAAHNIRQYASFAVMLNIAYWGSNTYELRNQFKNATIGETYFGKYAWFVITHISYPLCIFFYFHIAVCYANVVSSASQFGPLWSRNKLRSE